MTLLFATKKVSNIVVSYNIKILLKIVECVAVVVGPTLNDVVEGILFHICTEVSSL